MFKKNFSIYLLLSLCCLINIAPLLPHSLISTQITTTYKECPYCQHPFRRLISSMHALKKEGLMTESEFKKAFDAAMVLPIDSFKKAKDKDQYAANTLYKHKVITKAQYKKISAFLKNNPPLRE